MAELSVYNMEGQEVSKIELSDAVFAAPVKGHLVHQAVVLHLANMRQGTQKAKTRHEVSGGGRKPWRQKGTGHARQGSIRAAQWKGGGVIFAPVPRDYSFKMNRKEKKAAMTSALTSKVESGSMIILDKLAFDEIKTKNMANVLKALNVEKALVVTKGYDENVVMSGRNIAGIRMIPTNNINVYDLMKYEKVVMTEEAVKAIEEVYA